MKIRKLWRWLLLTAIGFGVFCGLTATRSIAVQVNPGRVDTAPPSVQLPSVQLPSVQLPSVHSTTATGLDLLQQGLDAYKVEQFETAIALWQQALTAFQDGPADRQALTHNYLALAYQQLGQWQAAERAIQQGFQQLAPTNPATDPATDPASRAIVAKLFNTQGQLHWSQGNFQAALKDWEQASQAYAAESDRTGVLISQINRARALQVLGFSVQAEQTLAEVEQRLGQEPDPTLQAIGLRDLGNALRRIGNLQASRQVLAESLSRAIDPATQAAIQLELGNTERALGNRAVAIGDSQADIHFQAAQTAYQQAAIAPSTLLQLQAQLNRLSLFVDLEQTAAAIDLASMLQPQFEQLPLSRTRLYAQLNYARRDRKSVV